MTKTFADVTALDHVSLDVHSGEILAVLGHNGSGKSTLVKLLAGVYQADEGLVALANDGADQTELHFIHQDLGLIPQLSAAENIHLTADGGTSAIKRVKTAQQRQRAVELISRFGAPFDVTVPVMALTPAEQAIVTIARAMNGWQHERNVLILDEPTEALHKSEVNVLFSAIRQVAAAGAGVVFISHRLDEVLGLADRAVVLRDGRVVADSAIRDLNHDRLVELVTGLAPVQASRESQRVFGDEVLRVRGLRGRVVRGIDLAVRRSEILGIAGVLGSGREEVPTLLFTGGDADTFAISGRARDGRSPADSIDAGMAFVPGDRRGAGSIADFTARENVTLPGLDRHRSLFRHIRVGDERREVGGLIRQYGVRPPYPERRFSQFSGGNQQKLVMAKWLRGSPNLLLLEEPTQGVDVGAKADIYEAIESAAQRGAAVIVCSSDARELVRLCDRVIVLRDGLVNRELWGVDLTEDRLLSAGYGLDSSSTPVYETEET